VALAVAVGVAAPVVPVRRPVADVGGMAVAEALVQLVPARTRVLESVRVRLLIRR
jgi:hypothetical protein